MPIAYLDVPQGIQTEEKKKMLKRIYEALSEAYPNASCIRKYSRIVAEFIEWLTIGDQEQSMRDDVQRILGASAGSKEHRDSRLDL